MTLLITIFAAIVTTIAWYVNFESGMKLGTLCLIYWGAALMWLVDAIAGYIKLGAASSWVRRISNSRLNDSYLGLSVVALGLIIWLSCSSRIRRAGLKQRL